MQEIKYIIGLINNNMMRAMDFIWYKLYLASLKSSLSKPRGLLASIILSVIIFSNIIVLNAFFSKINIFPFVFHQIKWIPIIQIVLFAIIYFYYNKRRCLIIIKKYRAETKTHHIFGNICLIIYIFLSFFLIILVSLYKPGYLP